MAAALLPGLAGAAGSGLAASEGAGGIGDIGFLNPASLFLFSLFGTRPRVSSSGKVKFGNIGPKLQAKIDRAGEQGIFGRPERDAIEDFLNPLPLSQSELDSQDLFGQLPADLDNVLSLFDDFIIPQTKELATTGFPTDIQPIVDFANRNFQRETLPEITQRFAGQVGTASSDFFNATTGAGADIATELGALQFEADEAATGRRIGGLGALPGLGAARVALPQAVGRDLFDFGRDFRLAEESTRPGGRVLDIFSALAGLANPRNLGAVATPKAPSTLSTVLQAIGGLGIGGLGGGGGGGTPGGNPTGAGSGFNFGGG